MAVRMWRPFEMGEMNRMFDSLFGNSIATYGDQGWAPRCDLWETKDDLVLAVEMPGVNEKDVTVSITGDLLTIRGERRSPDAARESILHHVERAYGKFERALQVPIPVQTDKVTASYRDGVLTVTLPKVEEVKPRDVKIEVM